jgi:hypothetical protein
MNCRIHDWENLEKKEAGQTNKRNLFWAKIVVHSENLETGNYYTGDNKRYHFTVCYLVWFIEDCDPETLQLSFIFHFNVYTMIQHRMAVCSGSMCTWQLSFHCHKMPFPQCPSVISPCGTPNNHPITIGMLSHAECEMNAWSASPFHTVSPALQVVTVFCTLLNLAYLFCNSPNYTAVTCIKNQEFFPNS